MISESSDCFPNNVIGLLAAFAPSIDQDCCVVKRPMQITDPDQCIAITAIDWAPELKTTEIAGWSPGQPTVQIYKIAVQGLIEDMDEAAGLARNSAFAKLLRDMLYTNRPLRIALQSLAVKDQAGKVVESTLSWLIHSQKFDNNQVDASFMYLSTLELWFKTQVFN